MKKFTFLILLFFIFSCDKDEPKSFSEERSIQEIYDAIIGTWRPYRLAYDENFKQIVCMMDSPCEQKYHVTFYDNWQISTASECISEYSLGGYSIEKEQRNSHTYIKIKLKDLGIFLSPTMEQVGGATLHNYTDSTLIFSEVSHKKDGKSIPNLYSEFKRVK